jgi:hypothetical protein
MCGLAVLGLTPLVAMVRLFYFQPDGLSAREFFAPDIRWLYCWAWVTVAFIVFGVIMHTGAWLWQFRVVKMLLAAAALGLVFTLFAGLALDLGGAVLPGSASYRLYLLMSVVAFFVVRKLPPGTWLLKPDSRATANVEISKETAGRGE